MIIGKCPLSACLQIASQLQQQFRSKQASMPSGCEKVKLGLLRKQLSLGSLTRKISRTSSHASSAVDEEEVRIREEGERTCQSDRAASAA